ncbi:DUF839 domain-containing protein [Domibacillus indicus]|uniref:PhoX family protein n=1 Tax=Domibacillus indicus TaxID=1437523 RepID=UPI00203E93AE|nr:alkaline phosphatase PhoX [Domibacillus indicus]MCM3791236.1 DUF839 domain-containing protein [Domibacillus indicus]
MSQDLNRRKFLTYVGTGVTALTVASAGLGAFAPKTQAEGTKAASHLFGRKKKVSGVKFTPIEASGKDELVLPRGYKYDVIASYGDVINKSGDTFGYNNDFTMFFPIDGSNQHGLLWVNHEYTSDLWVTGAPVNGKYSASQIQKLLYNQGGSIIEIRQDEEGVWKMDTSSKYARRISGLTPFRLTGPARGSKAVGSVDIVQGTFANCSGGKTLWNTVLSAEENYESTSEAASLNETHYGWILEVDPFDPNFAPRKHTALGRFHHENAAMGLTNDGRIAVYMGDDKQDACVYKFISKNKYVESRKQANSDLLEEGTLYAANLGKGTWVALTIEAVRAAAKGNADILAKFQTQADVLVHAHDAAILLGATPTDRPEDVEISPFDKSVFIAHTNNAKHGNIHGHITRFLETNDDLGSLTFDFEIFACGGRQSGFSAPDNLTFDSEGNLWTVTDMSSGSMNKGVFETFKNNGVFVIPTSGAAMGEAYQFASAPIDAELTGPCFTDDETTLFLAVQHPGEETEDINNPTSMWPHRKGDNQPRPSVVAITGFKY